MGLPADKSFEFIQSGMTLITEIESEKHLKRIKKPKKSKINKKE